MEIWIIHKTATFIKTFSSNGKFIYRRIYFKNQRGRLISIQNLLPVMFVPHGRQDTEMLNVESTTNIPIQNFADKFSVITDDIKMIRILL